jgi:sulfane dehydrogenase subunit SoxC
MEWGNVAVPTVQYSHGMLSCSEFTGVPLKLLLDHVRRRLQARPLRAGRRRRRLQHDAHHPDGPGRVGEVLVAYGQNGEMLRPENGYPLRLVVPGVQGVSWVKYLRRIEVGDSPTPPRTRPSTTSTSCPTAAPPVHQHPGMQERGHHALGRPGAAGQGLLQHQRPGLVGPRQGQAVDVSTDGGRNWRPARLAGPVMDKCLTRFNLDWVWDGKPALVQSRATDDTGYVQPTYRQLRAVRGTRSIYHNNSIQSWLVQESGEVKNVQLS